MRRRRGHDRYSIVTDPLNEHGTSAGSSYAADFSNHPFKRHRDLILWNLANACFWLGLLRQKSKEALRKVFIPKKKHLRLFHHSLRPRFCVFSSFPFRPSSVLLSLQLSTVLLSFSLPEFGPQIRSLVFAPIKAHSEFTQAVANRIVLQTEKKKIQCCSVRCCEAEQGSSKLYFLTYEVCSEFLS